MTKTSIEKIMITTLSGKRKRAKKITIISNFDTSVDNVWRKILDIETLIEICKPKATFTSRLPSMPTSWQTGITYPFNFFMYGFIPFGKHEICLDRIDEKVHEIQSIECNKMVPVWNHFIKMESTCARQIKYTDEVEIYAGMLTSFVAFWGIRFYKHRHRKWKQIARVMESKTQ